MKHFICPSAWTTVVSKAHGCRDTMVAVLQAGVPVVIALKGFLDENRVASFVEAVYECLFCGGTAVEAFQLATDRHDRRLCPAPQMQIRRCSSNSGETEDHNPIEAFQNAQPSATTPESRSCGVEIGLRWAQTKNAHRLWT